jgi:hypothetical protein
MMTITTLILFLAFFHGVSIECTTTELQPLPPPTLDVTHGCPCFTANDVDLMTGCGHELKRRTVLVGFYTTDTTPDAHYAFTFVYPWMQKDPVHYSSDICTTRSRDRIHLSSCQFESCLRLLHINGMDMCFSDSNTNNYDDDDDGDDDLHHLEVIGGGDGGGDEDSSPQSDNIVYATSTKRGSTRGMMACPCFTKDDTFRVTQCDRDTDGDVHDTFSYYNDEDTHPIFQLVLPNRPIPTHQGEYLCNTVIANKQIQQKLTPCELEMCIGILSDASNIVDMSCVP